jgi:hypothetical protein
LTGRDSTSSLPLSGAGWTALRVRPSIVTEVMMKEKMSVLLNLEVEEIERREKAGGTCTSSTTSRHCTCMCINTTAAIR